MTTSTRTIPDGLSPDRAWALTDRLRSLVRGIESRPGEAVVLAGPALAAREQAGDWQELLTTRSETYGLKRLALRDQIRALKVTNDFARASGVSLKEAASQLAVTNQRALEQAWVTLREKNVHKERSVRSVASYFANLQTSRAALHDKVFVVDMGVREAATQAGLEHLAGMLSEHIHRPDTRQARGYVLAPGWAGSTEAVARLARVVDEHRAVLFTDARPYHSMEALREAAKESGPLGELAGEDLYHRHAIVLGNWVRARRRFVGRYAEEESSLFIPPSAPWLGMYMDKIAQGKPFEPTVGYQYPILGVDGVMLDLKLKDFDGFKLYHKHRINPCILLAANSNQVVVWGPYALSKAGEGVQIGVAVVESELIRYAEWVLNKEALHRDLEVAEARVRGKLSKFIQDNSGAGRMFRAGSGAEVHADYDNKTIEVKFRVLYREVAEHARIRMTKETNPDAIRKPAAVTVEA